VIIFLLHLIPHCIKNSDISFLSYQVLDEADKLLNDEFEKSIDEILNVIPRERRTYLFSATMTKKVCLNILMVFKRFVDSCNSCYINISSSIVLVMCSQGMHGWFLDEKIYVVVHIIFYSNEKGILFFVFQMFFNLFMLTDVSLG
jgi:hypothetical protein